MTVLANLFMRVFLLTFMVALFLSGCDTTAVVHRLQRPPGCNDDCWQRVRGDLDAATAKPVGIKAKP